MEDRKKRELMNDRKKINKKSGNRRINIWDREVNKWMNEWERQIQRKHLWKNEKEREMHNIVNVVKAAYHIILCCQWNVSYETKKICFDENIRLACCLSPLILQSYSDNKGEVKKIKKMLFFILTEI